VSGESQGFFAQVGWRPGIVGQHGHDILRFEQRPDAATDRLTPVGCDHLHRYPEVIADELEKLAQPHRFHGGCKLRGRANRKVDQQVGRACGKLL